MERWHLQHGGRRHELEIEDAGLGRRLVWRVDGREVASRKTSDDKVVLSGAPGAVGVRLPAFGNTARRVTWWSPEAELGAEAAAHTGLGGTDFVPEDGSRAAVREAWIRDHPRQYAARRAAAAAVGVIVPLLLIWLLGRVALPAIPWPDLPDVPWPDLPSIPWPSVPWPDLPSIPWPDWQVPGWLQTLLGYAKYVGPVVLALVLARGELRRRRQQDERRRLEAAQRADNDPQTDD